MKPSNRGCLDWLILPISPTSPLFAFVYSHLAVLGFYSRLVRARGLPHSEIARVCFFASGLLIASFVSIKVSQFFSRLLATGYGETDEPFSSPRAKRITRLLAILALVALLVVYLLTHFDPSKPAPIQ